MLLNFFFCSVSESVPTKRCGYMPDTASENPICLIIIRDKPFKLFAVVFADFNVFDLNRLNGSAYFV